MLTRSQIDFYWDNGYLHLPQMFSPDEMDELDADLTRLIETWAVENMGWTGPWRRAYMDEETDRKSTLIHLHDLQLYSAAWLRAVSKPELAEAMADLLDSAVELHHTTLHAKPPSAGHPFPMHQDSPFYQHENGRFVDVLVHLDDTNHANGEIRFLPGSHKLGHLEHITQTEEGPCSPHLPTAEYRLEDTVAVPARRGDVVCFSIYTIHGSYLNTTDRVRRLVRVGYRDPANRQLGGQSAGRPGIIVYGLRERAPEMAVLPQS